MSQDINAGIYLLSPKLFVEMEKVKLANLDDPNNESEAISLERDIIIPLVRTNNEEEEEEEEARKKERKKGNDGGKGSRGERAHFLFFLFLSFFLSFLLSFLPSFWF